MNVEKLRSDIPVTQEIVYLNSGAGTPCPDRVIESMNETLQNNAHVAPASGSMYSAVSEVLENSRKKLANFLGAKPSEIALTHSTADGASRIANAIPWKSGDTVVQTDIGHPATSLPFRRFADIKGIDIDIMQTKNGHIDLNKLADAASNAKLVTIDSITWTHGTQLPISKIVDIVHNADARILVDAVHSPGQTNVDFEEWGADFVVGSSHKWLLGPWGAGFLYVREGAERFLHPRRVSHWSVEDKWTDQYRLKPGAKRLEVGGSSPAPYAGLQESIDLIDSIGIGAISKHIKTLSTQLKNNIDPEALLSPNRYESGMVTFQVKKNDQVERLLHENGIIVRSLPVPNDAVRVSIHAFNTTEDIKRLVDTINMI